MKVYLVEEEIDSCAQQTVAVFKDKGKAEEYANKLNKKRIRSLDVFRVTDIKLKC